MATSRVSGTHPDGTKTDQSDATMWHTHAGSLKAHLYFSEAGRIGSWHAARSLVDFAIKEMLLICDLNQQRTGNAYI